MTQANHTPGPWNLGEEIDNFRSISVPLWSEFANVVVRLEDDDRPYFRGEANARLIAAAPDLLEALTEAEAYMSIVEPRSDKAEYGRTLGVVRAAIAKATGAA